MRRHLVFPLIGIVIASLTACSSDNGTFIATGMITLPLDNSAQYETYGTLVTKGAPCVSKPAIASGEQVLVADASGKTIARGAVDQAGSQGNYNVFDKFKMYCEVAFTVEGVPAGEEFYSVDVAGLDLGTYTEAELSAGIELAE